MHGSLLGNAAGFVVGPLMGFNSEVWTNPTFRSTIPEIARDRDNENPDYIDRISLRVRGLVVFHEVSDDKDKWFFLKSRRADAKIRQSI